jgi:hypothetical protein
VRGYKANHVNDQNIRAAFAKGHFADTNCSLSVETTKTMSVEESVSLTEW